MTQSDSPPENAKDSPPATAAWDTWEELLLASAVNRWGTKNWDHISAEVRKRTSAPIRLTPHHCEQKYRELKRRFNDSEDNNNDDNDGVVVMDDGVEMATTTTTAAVPWLEELKKLRMLELQRILQDYDLHIASLESKLKQSEESKKNDGETKNKSELGHGTDEIEIDTAEEEATTETETAEPAVSGDEDSDRDNQSVNGSNGNLDTGVEKSENGNEMRPVRTGVEKKTKNQPKPDEPDDPAEPDEPAEQDSGSAPVIPVHVDSCEVEPVRTEPEGDVSQAPESAAESKSEGKNSDVQSSASKSRRSRRDRVPRGSKGDARENEDQSTDSIPVRSLPLVDFLQKLHKLGSVVFERRLDQQEKLRYKNIIRQPIDYETLQTRLKEGWYSDGNDKFFRDLLLLVNNTIMFFPEQSPESTTAIDLHQFILKEMTKKKKQKTPSKPATPPSKLAADPPDSLLLKPKLTVPIVVCRKRSSIAAKGAGSSSGKREPTSSKSSEKLADENPKKSRSRDSSPLVTKRKGKSPVTETPDVKRDTKRKLTEVEEKKQSAAKFLNRMKRSNEPLMNTSERDGSESGGESDGKRGQAGKKSSSARQTKEQGSSARRSVGRPPKRGVPVPPPSLAALGKRGREPADSETLGSKQQTKKRSKR